MNGSSAYDRLCAFVRDNMPHFEREYGVIITWGIEQWTEVITSCFFTMENVAMYDDVDEDHCMSSDDLFAAFTYAHENYLIDDEGYYMLERNEGIMTMLARAIRDEITE